MKPGEKGSSAKRSKRSDRKEDYKLSGRPMDVRLAVEEKGARSKIISQLFVFGVGEKGELAREKRLAANLGYAAAQPINGRCATSPL